MAIINGYVTRGQLQDEVAAGSSTWDTGRADRICYQASRIVDDWTHRRFYPVIETRYFTPTYGDVLWVDDLLSVTTLKTDHDGDRTYETTWATTDYDLEPYNADEKNHPYTAVRLTPQSLQFFPAGVSRGVEISGKWGYMEVTEASGSLLNGAIGSTTATSVVVDNEAHFEVGHILKVGTEYMRVDAVTTNSTHTLTVVRGINGSTAATHDNDTVVYLLRFPNIAEAALRLAVRIWHLRTAPMGVATAGVQGLTGGTSGTRWVQEDHDIQNWLAPYRGGKML